MDYQEARAYIAQIQAGLGSDYSLRDVRELCRRAGRPDRGIAVIHIAGTNGKGSVGTFIANVLAASGYRVGRYVSPAVFSYRERIQQIFQTEKSADFVSSPEWISRTDTARILTELKKESEEMQGEGFSQPTAFEMETVMAFVMFQRWNVDVAVVECGMGGRLDATNIIEKPLLCVFSSISRDHMAILGNSVQEIAAEKYGIIKENAIVVSARQKECETLLKKVCGQKQARLFWVQEEKSSQTETMQDGQYAKEETACRGDGLCFSYRGEIYRLTQGGIYQIENARLAVEAAFALQGTGLFHISPESIKNGLANSRWKGRFDVVSQNPFLLADGAHNPDAARKLSLSLSACYPGEKFRFIIGAFRDKEYGQVMAPLLPLAETVYTVSTSGDRGLSAEQLKAEAERLVLQGCQAGTLEEGMDVCACETMKDALDRALESGKRTVVFGSLSIIRDVYSYAG
ncbi:MAG: bifunctional folylpolyglutamate synthase/dihydrofolate synthase [Clostridiaceae bacterium]|nr:bifunctional folylpolyglutamate synthase/dihydrofolate synthase [Clostridiaceae bacterium]